MSNLIQPISHSADRHNLEPIEHASRPLFTEYIGSRDKDFALTVNAQDSHRIAKCVTMIRRIDNSSVGRDILLTYILDMSIGRAKHPIDIWTQDCV